jgi:hypothetical protein
VTAVHARDLHAGSLLHRNDWHLHVTSVVVDGASVALAVTEFDFLLHYTADEMVDDETAEAGAA